MSICFDDGVGAARRIQFREEIGRSFDIGDDNRRPSVTTRSDSNKQQQQQQRSSEMTAKSRRQIQSVASVRSADKRTDVGGVVGRKSERLKEEENDNYNNNDNVDQPSSNIHLKRKRNREAAARCRQRRQDLTNELEDIVEQLLEEKRSLDSTIAQYRSVHEYLKRALDRHHRGDEEMSCQLVVPNRSSKNHDAERPSVEDGVQQMVGKERLRRPSSLLLGQSLNASSKDALSTQSNVVEEEDDEGEDSVAKCSHRDIISTVDDERQKTNRPSNRRSIRPSTLNIVYAHSNSSTDSPGIAIETPSRVVAFSPTSNIVESSTLSPSLFATSMTSSKFQSDPNSNHTTVEPSTVSSSSSVISSTHSDTTNSSSLETPVVVLDPVRLRHFSDN